MTNTPPPSEPRDRSHSGLYFAVGALCIAAVILGYFVLGGEWPVGGGGGDNVDVNVTTEGGSDSGTSGDSGSSGDAGESGNSDTSGSTGGSTESGGSSSE
jgi:hypothetical protein